MKKTTRTIMTLVLLTPVAVAANTGGPASGPAPVQQSVPRPLPQLGSAQATDSRETEALIASVREERRVLEAQADRQYAQLGTLIGWASGLLGLFAVLFSAAVAWFMGSTRRDARTFVEEYIEREAREKIQVQISKFQEQVGAEAEQLRDLLTGMKRQLDDLNAFRAKRVVWVHDGRTPISAEERLLEHAGVRIDTLVPVDGMPVDPLPADLVVLTHDGSDKADDILAKLVDRLRDNLSPIPMLVYTKTRLSAVGESQAARYAWLQPVNYPLTLLANTMSLLTGLRGEPGGGRRA